MDFLAAIRIVFRRWHVVLSALILTGAAAFTVMQAVAPSYQARGSALIIAPSPTPSIEGGVDPLSLNPFARVDASTNAIAAVTVEIMDDIDVRERLAAEGANPDYEIGLSTTSPVLSVLVIDPVPEQAIQSASLVLAAVNQELDRRQADAGAPEESRIRALIVTEPTRTTQLVGARVRAFTAVAALGIAASVSLAFLVEAFAQGRQRRREEATEALESFDVPDSSDRQADEAPSPPPPSADDGGSIPRRRRSEPAQQR